MRLADIIRMNLCWEFMNASRGLGRSYRLPGRGRRELRVRVGGRLAFNDPRLTVTAALAGFGLACVPEDYAAAPPAFALLVEALRYRG